jgi:hypothetical protein
MGSSNSRSAVKRREALQSFLYHEVLVCVPPELIHIIVEYECSSFQGKCVKTSTLSSRTSEHGSVTKWTSIMGAVQISDSLLAVAVSGSPSKESKVLLCDLHTFEVVEAFDTGMSEEISCIAWLPVAQCLVVGTGGGRMSKLHFEDVNVGRFPPGSSFWCVAYRPMRINALCALSTGCLASLAWPWNDECCVEIYQPSVRHNICDFLYSCSSFPAPHRYVHALVFVFVFTVWHCGGL